VKAGKKIGQCLSKLKAKEWFHLLKGAAFEFAWALALEAVLVAVTEGAAAATWAAKIHHFIHANAKILKAFSGAKAVSAEVAHAC
jgi:hypothetical protein